MNKLQNIVQEIKRLERELIVEIQKKEEEFFYKIKGGRVYFEEEAKQRHRRLAKNICRYVLGSSILNTITTPIIWSCLIPAVFMDLVVSIFHFICFRVYGIPRVKRRDYIVVDRQRLNYLNGIEKVNCVYCGYFNGLIAYVQEIAARTEQYWCPIRHAKKLYTIHSRYHKFLDYGDCEDYHKKLLEIRKDYGDLEPEK